MSLRTPISATVALLCPFCSAEQEVAVTALGFLDDDGTGPRRPSFEDVEAAPLPSTCWHCEAPHIDRDLAPKLTAALARLTTEDFR